jgi:ATP-dependent DNA helicase RecG
VNIDSKIDQVKGVGPALRDSFASIGVITVRDLLLYFPRTYDDYSDIKPISDIEPGKVTIKVRFQDIKASYRTGGLHITSANASDDTGSVLISWFNQPYRAKSLKAGQEYFASGTLEFKYGRYQLINPNIEVSIDSPTQTGRILAIYPEKKTIKSSQIRKVLDQVIVLADQIHDHLPKDIVQQQELLTKAEAIRQIHKPDSAELLSKAKSRLGFEEVFELQLAALLSKQQNQAYESPELVFDAEKTSEFLTKLKFKLTDAQRKSAWQILQDISKEQSMNRLLQGDVGSGKTVVAGMAIEQCLRSGMQAVLMAPTEVLAAQHAKTLVQLLPEDKVVMLIGDIKSNQKNEILARAANGESLLFVGTHALIQKAVAFKNLGLAVIDEQHRFGVRQRQKLMSGKKMPHLLSMTATPIPRTLALTVYGDLDISVIDEMPPGRSIIETRVVPFASSAEIDRLVDEVVAKRERVYIVCPLIEESESLELKNVKQEFERIKTAHPVANVGILHGKMKSEEKQAALSRFKTGEIDILVSTTVIEVGVDVPDASLIIIEGAERFGLAQLHQLRGRVGRSEIKAKCMLVTSAGVKPSTRLRAMEQTNSGFKLAEIDMKLRGPGAIYGTKQHGLLDLRMASLNDSKLIASIRQTAQNFLDSGVDMSHYPELFTRIIQLRGLTQLN